MLRFVLRRLVQLVPVLGQGSRCCCSSGSGPAGDPARALLGEGDAGAWPGSPRRTGSTNRSLQQYVTYVTALLHGDFGNSIELGNR